MDAKLLPAAKPARRRRRPYPCDKGNDRIEYHEGADDLECKALPPRSPAPVPPTPSYAIMLPLCTSSARIEHNKFSVEAAESAFPEAEVKGWQLS